MTKNTIVDDVILLIVIVRTQHFGHKKPLACGPFFEEWNVTAQDHLSTMSTGCPYLLKRVILGYHLILIFFHGQMVSKKEI